MIERHESQVANKWTQPRSGVKTTRECFASSKDIHLQGSWSISDILYVEEALEEHL